MKSRTLLVIVFIMSFIYLYVRNRTYLRENFVGVPSSLQEILDLNSTKRR